MKVVISTYVIKEHAKRAMRGRFFTALCACLVPALVIVTIAAAIIYSIPGAVDSFELMLTGDFASGQAQEEYQAMLMNDVMYCLEIVTALFTFLLIGGERVCLDMVRGKKEVKVRRVFAFYDKWYIAIIMPLATFSLSFGANVLMDSLPALGVNSLVTEVVGSVASILILILSIKLCYFNLALADTNCDNFITALKKSWKITDLRMIANTIVLMFSFIGWAFMCALTGGVLFIYVYPYAKLSLATLYDVAVRGMENKEQNAQESL